MATIITRASKGSALTNAELDSNLTNLNTEITARASATNITGTVTVPNTTAVTVTTNSMPSIRPSLQLDFVNNNRLDSRVTFTRASTATRTNARGILETVAVNAPRFDYAATTLACRGLLIEEARTNSFGNTVINGSSGTIGTGTVLGPDNNNCRTFIPAAGNISFPSYGTITQSFSATLGQTVDYTWSGYFAAGAPGTLVAILEPLIAIAFAVAGPTSVAYATLQLNTTTWTVRNKGLDATITEVAAPSIVLVSTGLYRVTWTVRYTQDAIARNAVWAQIQARTTFGSGTFTSDGIASIQYAFCQFELGSYATSVIPTTTAAVTRAVDTATMTGTNFSSWYNPVEGTLYAEVSNLTRTPSVTYPRLVALSGSDVNTDEISLYTRSQGATAGWAFGSVSSSGTATFDPGSLATVVDSWKAALAYKTNDAAFASSGLLYTPDTTVTVPTCVQLQIFGSVRYQLMASGYVSRITYYPVRLPNTTLQALST